MIPSSSPTTRASASSPPPLLFLLRRASSAHGAVIKLGLSGDLLLCNRLLALYAELRRGGVSGPAHARMLFDEMPRRDVASWTAAISAHARAGLADAALGLFRRMLAPPDPSAPVAAPNEFTYSAILRCCADRFSLGSQIHAQIWRRGFGANTFVGGALLDFYSKFGEFRLADQVFATMDYKDVISWTIIITAYVEAGDLTGAVNLYTAMVGGGTAPTEFTFAKLLTGCRLFRCCRIGELLHAHLIIYGMHLNLVLKTALVNMYSKCRDMGRALTVFRQTPDMDVMLWTAMIAGYSQRGEFKEAIALLKEMEIAGVTANAFTYAGVVSACSSVSVLQHGAQIHCRTVKIGLEQDSSVGNAIVDLYAKCSTNVWDSISAFRAINYPNVISWTVLIAGLARHGQGQEAFVALAEMRASGVQPNSFTLSAILSGCGFSLEALAHAKKLHGYVLKTTLDSLDVAVGNSLVDLYARYSMMQDAWMVAKTMMNFRDVFTYTSIAKGLNQMGLHMRALEMMTQMHNEGIEMDGFSLACFLSSTAGLTAIECGKQLHCSSMKLGLNNKVSVSNSLLDMYGKCGCIKEARSIFMEIEEPNVVSWNSLISGLASNGLISQALSAFEDMRLAKIKPDSITILVVMYACSHGGLVDVGIEHFNSMREIYGLPPQRDHYACLLDLLGRAGRLEEAAFAMESMPFEPDVGMYKTILASCKLYGNLVLGECMAKKALETNPTDPSIYVLLASMYDDVGKLEWGDQIRKMMRERVARKCAGQSWMQISN
ncbi:Pentatricopeptide repeat-containing protein, chloroplastic [Ananas comosus]|uniref:Pentatricopeptide repeat-containing protein, chloroplastic n=1 Tax=Ananas comosus TaxID=4615 RepID=A0A199URG6_ANACO|nr:Pentatricopeptide repeat-containing protein, chloroplastic [Ananas comosus]